MKVYFVRHGQTRSNEENKYYGDYESELTSFGIKQAKLIGEKLSNINFEKVYCSPRNRAITTLEQIVDEVKKIVFEPLISERSFGIFENKTYEEIKNSHVIECSEWEKDWIEYKIPNGESYIDSYKRAEEFMKILETQQDENVLVITHGGIIRNMYCYILGSMESFWKFSSCNGDITVVKYEYGNWVIDSINHL